LSCKSQMSALLIRMEISGLQMDSPLMRSDLDILLTMEIKLRLLDTEGIRIPSTPPPIPPDPPNYNFVVKA